MGQGTRVGGLVACSLTCSTWQENAEADHHMGAHSGSFLRQTTTAARMAGSSLDHQAAAALGGPAVRPERFG